MKRNLLRFYVLFFYVILFTATFAQDSTRQVGWIEYNGFPVDSYGNLNFFPEAIVSSYSSFRVAYDAFDMGSSLNNKKIIRQMKIPFLTVDDIYGNGNYSPFDFWDSLFGQPAKVPLDVAIYVRNSSKMLYQLSDGSKYPAGSYSLDTSAANGWIKVWDGFFDFEQNEIEKIEVKNHSYRALVINFIEPFLYTGNVLEIIFINKSGSAPIIVDDNGNIKDINKKSFYYIYPFFKFYQGYLGVTRGSFWTGTGIIMKPYDFLKKGTILNNNYISLSNDYYSYGCSVRPFIEFTYKNDTISYQNNTSDVFNIGFDKPIKFSYPTYGSENAGYFPEAIVSPYSATRVAYTAKEMGETPKLLTQMKLPYTPEDLLKFDHEHYGNSKPYNIWDTLNGEPDIGKIPLDVAIYVRNSSVIPENTSFVDTSAANGWVKIWDGFFDFEQNEIVNIKIDVYKSYPALLINFDEPFLYTGVGLEIVFVNKSGSAPIIVDDKGKIKHTIKGNYHYMYPFLTFYVHPFSHLPGMDCAGTGIIIDPYGYFNGDTIHNNYNILSKDYYTKIWYYRPIVEFTYQNDTSSISYNQSNLEIDITPNPVTNKVSISFNSLETNTSIELLDISGSSLGTIYDGLLETGNHTIDYDLSKHHLSNGTYFIKLIQGKNVQIKQFILAK